MVDKKVFILPAGILVLISGYMLYIRGIYTPGWLIREVDGKICTFDLWNSTSCKDKIFKTPVDPYDGEYPELTVVKMSVGFGMVSGLTAIGSSFWYCATSEDKAAKTAMVNVGLTFSSIVAAATVYGVGVFDKDKKTGKALIELGFRLGYSYIMTILSGIVMAGGGTLFFWGKRFWVTKEQTRQDSKETPQPALQERGANEELCRDSYMKKLQQE